MTRYDIAIIGAGPAGSAAAITAARAGQRVLLLDKDDFPRHKVCGEFVSFESTRLLQCLLSRDVGGFPRIQQVRLFRGDDVYEGSLRAAALSISRYELDAMLVDAARTSGAEMRTDCRVLAVAPQTDGFRWRPVTEPITTAPIIFGPPEPVTRDMANVGDAAAFIDPFLGDGIAIALQTGALAARCLVNGDVERYRDEYLRWVAPALRRAALLRRLSGSALAWQMMRLPGMVGATARATRVHVDLAA
jgi:flavin-dependent dehydrogenase